ncbi:hypothetical protein [Desulfotalea psychrophila]|uniref:hypothetical protein n=1 Tax=Desulfotalea psychrophila TaxID=84980 RepID=UPI0012EAA946|nr:hypothetical protein [Desulfotalea psychrophila]
MLTKIVPLQSETKTIPGLPSKEMVLVRYVGKRKLYNDSLFGTGMWEKDQIKRVPLSIATKMLVHTSVYVVDEGGATASATFPKVGKSHFENKKTEEAKRKQDEVEDSLMVMDSMTSKKTVVDFILANFPNYKIELEKTEKLDVYKDLARNLVNQFGLA